MEQYIKTNYNPSDQQIEKILKEIDKLERKRHQKMVDFLIESKEIYNVEFRQADIFDLPFEDE